MNQIKKQKEIIDLKINKADTREGNFNLGDFYLLSS